MSVLEYPERPERIEQYEERSESLSIYERAVLFLAMGLLFVLCVVAVWSWVLLFLENVDGGGPLGLLMKALPLHLFL